MAKSFGESFPKLKSVCTWILPAWFVVLQILKFGYPGVPTRSLILPAGAVTIGLTLTVMSTIAAVRSASSNDNPSPGREE